MRLGDLDNDGRLELVLIQPDVIADDRYFPHSVAAATAFSLEGDILWQIGTPAGDIPACNANLPAQIYDFDNDGSNEFLCVMDGEFCIFDGLNGTLKLKYPLPSPDAHDCFAIADLEGTGYAQNIILKNKYHMLWALDKNFNVIWTAVGNMGHFPLPCDLDGDGRDEVVVGYSVFSADGELLWKAEGMEKHPQHLALQPCPGKTCEPLCFVRRYGAARLFLQRGIAMGILADRHAWRHRPPAISAQISKALRPQACCVPHRASTNYF